MYSSSPSFCLKDKRSGSAQHGYFDPSWVTTESITYRVSLFDFIIAIFLYKQSKRTCDQTTSTLPKLTIKWSNNKLMNYLPLMHSDLILRRRAVVLPANIGPTMTWISPEGRIGFVIWCWLQWWIVGVGVMLWIWGIGVWWNMCLSLIEYECRMD